MHYIYTWQNIFLYIQKQKNIHFCIVGYKNMSNAGLTKGLDNHLAGSAGTQSTSFIIAVSFNTQKT